MLRTIAVIAAVLPLLVPATVGRPALDPASEPPAEQATADVITVSGTGCAPGTVTSWITRDNGRLMLAYSAFSVWIGVGALPTDQRRNCQVALEVLVPSGYTYAIEQASYTAYVHLPKGGTGALATNFHFHGRNFPQAQVYSFAGPVYGIWRNMEFGPFEALDWAPCGERRHLNFNTELRLGRHPADDSGYISIEEGDGPWAYHLAWKQCEPEVADPGHREAGRA